MTRFYSAWLWVAGDRRRKALSKEDREKMDGWMTSDLDEVIAKIYKMCKSN